MEEQIPTLQAKILDEEVAVNEKIKEIEEEWKTKRPYSGNVEPKTALNLLTVIGAKITKANQDWIRICKAKELLDMELGNPKRLDPLEEDLEGLRSVWEEVGKVWAIIEQLNETLFSAYMHKKVKDQLELALNQMLDFPNRLRQYQVYDEIKDLIMKYRKTNITISELKSEAMKQRHWKDLLT